MLEPSPLGVAVALVVLLAMLVIVGVHRVARRRNRWEQPGDGWGFYDSRDSTARFRNIVSKE